jgi:hypothetical protein
MGTRLLLLAALLGGAAASGAVMVKREGARVMKAPRFFGEACPVQVSAGERVRLVERRGGWGRLAAPGGGRCWLHETAWSDREAGELVGDPAAASQRDLELAGRGFSEGEVGRYRADHPGLEADFALVEAYLAHAPETPPAELARFLAGGKLGGAR